MIALEWLVPPVVVKVFAIEAYAMPDEVEYLQVADSLVERDIAVWVVPAASVPVGWEDDLVGGVVSEVVEDSVFPEIILDRIEVLLASSIALIAK